jgi:hypothetical protein
MDENSNPSVATFTVEYRIYDPGAWSPPSNDREPPGGTTDVVGSAARHDLEQWVRGNGGIVEKQMPAVCAGDDVTLQLVLAYVGGGAAVIQMLEYGKRALDFLRKRNNRSIHASASADVRTLEAIAMFIASEHGAPFRCDPNSVKTFELVDGVKGRAAAVHHPPHAEPFEGLYQFEITNLAAPEIRVVQLSARGELIGYMSRPTTPQP